jgi:hypothetical protein
VQSGLLFALRRVAPEESFGQWQHYPFSEIYLFSPFVAVDTRENPAGNGMPAVQKKKEIQRHAQHR